MTSSTTCSFSVSEVPPIIHQILAKDDDSGDIDDIEDEQEKVEIPIRVLFSRTLVTIRLIQTQAFKVKCLELGFHVIYIWN